MHKDSPMSVPTFSWFYLRLLQTLFKKMPHKHLHRQFQHQYLVKNLSIFLKINDLARPYKIQIKNV